MGIANKLAAFLAEEAARAERRIAAFGPGEELYHFNKKVAKRGDEGFYPFTHVGTKRSAYERNMGHTDADAIEKHSAALASGKNIHGEELTPEYKKTLADIVDSYAYKSNDPAGTIPVYINQKNVLDIGGDSVTHGAWNIAKYAGQGIDGIPHARKTYSSFQAPKIFDALSDEEITALALGPETRVAQSAINTANDHALTKLFEQALYAGNLPASLLESTPILSLNDFVSLDTEVKRALLSKVLSGFDPLSAPAAEKTRHYRFLENVKTQNYDTNHLATNDGKAALQALADWFDEQQITALKYRNSHEDPGSISYMVPNPKNIRSRHAKFLDMDSKDIMAALPYGVGAAAAGGLLSRLGRREA